MKKVVNKRKILVLVEIIIGIILVLAVGIKGYFDFFHKSNTEVKEVDSIKLYGYTLSDTDTKLYKTKFNELSKILKKENVDYEQYASLLTELFIIDFYTLSNKVASTDIGGLEFIHKDQLENFILNAGDTMYEYIENNINGNREQSLPEVSLVTINSVKEYLYTYKEVEYDSYKVEATWEYKEDLGYETKGNFILIKDKTKLYVVESD